MKIYHKDIGFPSYLHLPDEYHLALTYTRHANKKRKEIGKNLPHNEIVKVPIEGIIELGINKKGKIKKMLVRREFDETRDIIFVLDLKLFSAKVVTLWLNNKNDKHSTLDKTKYSKP